ncbi:MAG: ImmA/IrrE family metallo-endopeptidase [Caldisericia bacterium]
MSELKQHAARKANGVLERFNIRSVPVNIEKILEHYNIELFHGRKLCSVRGCIVSSRKRTAIMVSNKLPHRYRRETIAHELKHYLCNMPDDFFQPTLKYYKNREIAAKVFAACLLVPGFLSVRQ